MSTFKFKLKQEVLLPEGGEHGRVVGRLDYGTDDIQYLVRYRPLYQKKKVEEWFVETSLRPFKASSRAEISENSLKVFDAEGQLRIKFEGPVASLVYSAAKAKFSS